MVDAAQGNLIFISSIRDEKAVVSEANRQRRDEVAVFASIEASQ
jgi:phosphosulfolactate phosphohydrolase-like enzyme